LSTNNYTTRVKRFSILLPLLLAFLLLTAACKPGDYNANINVRDASPEEKGRGAKLIAEADALQVANELARAKASTEAEVYALTARQNLELERQANEAKIKNTIARAETENKAIVAQSNAAVAEINTRAMTERANAIAQSEAWVQTTKMAGHALVAVGYALALSAVIFTTGRTAAHVKHQWTLADVLTLPQGNGVPPLLIIGHGSNRMLLDTFSGARAKLSESASIDRLRLAALARVIQASNGYTAAAQIAQSNRGRLSGGVTASQALAGISSSVPQIIDVAPEEATQ
jgi:hypothetical protein